MNIKAIIFFAILFVASTSFVNAEPIITFLNPTENLTITSEDTWLNISTDKYAVCKYELCFGGGPDDGVGYGGCSRPEKMWQTGKLYHLQLLEGLEDTINNETWHESYSATVKCEDDKGYAEKSVRFYVDTQDEIDIFACQELNKVNSTYILKNNIATSGEGTCLTLNADNIMLDLNNYEINGNGEGTAIKFLRSDYSTVKNGKINYFDRAISFQRNSNRDIINDLILTNSEQAVYGDNNRKNSIINNTIEFNDGGIWLAQVSQYKVENNKISHTNKEGIECYICKDNLIANNLINYGGRQAIYLSGHSENNTIRDNNVTSNGDGIINSAVGLGTHADNAKAAASFISIVIFVALASIAPRKMPGKPKALFT